MEWVRQYGIVAKQIGHSVEVVSLDDPKSPWLKNYPLAVHALGHGYKYLYSSRLVPWLLTYGRDYDHIIVHGLWRYPSLGTWRAMRKLELPYSIYTHGMLGGWFKKNHPFKHFVKSLYWLLFEYRVLRDAKNVFFTTDQERMQASDSFWCYKANEKVAPLGIADPAFARDDAQRAFYSSFPQLRGKRLLLFLGRIHKVKGCDLLIEAFSRVCEADSDLHLIIAGPDSGNVRPNLEELASRLGVSEKICWTGMIVDAEKWGAICASEAVALTSHHENFSFSTVEALACSKPVLLSDQVGIWREVDHYLAGLISDDDLNGAEQVLSRWLALNDTQQQLMSENARQCFLEQFEVEAATRSLLDMLAEN